MATLRHKLANIVSVSHSLIRLSLMKLFYPKNIFFSCVERFSPNVVIDTDKKSKIRFGRRVSIHSGGRLVSLAGGDLSIDDSTSFNVNCTVICRSKISIGKNVSVGPNVTIYDHNHIMNAAAGARGTDYSLGNVEIGDNCWIGAGVIILLGAKIGNNCVIAAGSVVTGEVPDNTVLIQKRTNTYKELNF